MITRRRYPMAVLLAVTTLLAGVAAGVDDFKVLGSHQASGRAVDVQGQFAYVGDGSNFRVFEIAQSGAPVARGSLALQNVITGIRAIGGKAYVTVSDNGPTSAGLVVVDVVNPAAPQRLGFTSTPGTPVDVDVSGQTAFVADGLLGFEVINVANPAAPQLVLRDPDHLRPGGGSLPEPPTAFALTISGNKAYIGGDVIRLYDISDPTSPTRELRIFPSSNSPAAGARAIGIQNIHVSSGTTYVLHGYTLRELSGNSRHWLQMSVYNLENPAQPKLRGIFGPRIGAAPTCLFTTGTLAYVGWYAPATTPGGLDSPGGVLALDVSNPAAIGILANHGAFPRDLAVAGDRVFVAANPFLVLRFIQGLTGARKWGLYR